MNFIHFFFQNSESFQIIIRNLKILWLIRKFHFISKRWKIKNPFIYGSRVDYTITHGRIWCSFSMDIGSVLIEVRGYLFKSLLLVGFVYITFGHGNKVLGFRIMVIEYFYLNLILGNNWIYAIRFLHVCFLIQYLVTSTSFHVNNNIKWNIKMFDVIVDIKIGGCHPESLKKIQVFDCDKVLDLHFTIRNPCFVDTFLLTSTFYSVCRIFGFYIALRCNNQVWGFKDTNNYRIFVSNIVKGLNIKVSSLDHKCRL